ncbi:MAG: DUF4160 domain-containing protein [Candidatus Viridilinea halotolerans]|uniref:DUF4160 domain-containing protein n=1 Tax=Candidatus Viridilinea halotolerans TaxID=2491704 RepID=A0A426TWL0_9CHLR|nr:MAG: DUF4160 domain-containing protein [Candidatus Viridilinea halotolerans]
MPTILRIGPYRFFFYSADCSEPAHVHIERDSQIAKFWLTPVRLAESGGFSRRELTRMHRLVEEHHATLLGGWDEHCNP